MEETLLSILASVQGWFTPAVLFLLINLVIGSIAIASKSSSSSAVSSGRRPGSLLPSSPSIVLDRLRSFDLLREAPPPLQVAAEILDGAPPPLPAKAATGDAPRRQRQSQHLGRSQSDAQPTAGEMPPKLAVQLKKSAFGHFEELEVEAAAVAAAAKRTEAVVLAAEEGGNEVDALADDFINRFRHELKLQQLEAIVRYKETLHRPSYN